MSVFNQCPYIVFISVFLRRRNEKGYCAIKVSKDITLLKMSTVSFGRLDIAL